MEFHHPNSIIAQEDVMSVLCGTAPALHITQAFSETVGNRITTNFVNSDGKKYRTDGVAGEYIGASHFKKNECDYYSESAKNEPYIDGLFEGHLDPVRSFYTWLEHALKKRGISLRRSQSAYGNANYCRALCWTDSGEYSLAPHDDLAQVIWSGSDFDFQSVAQNTVVALNFYASVPTTGGRAIG